jgi:hypothetical protein
MPVLEADDRCAFFWGEAPDGDGLQRALSSGGSTRSTKRYHGVSR